MECKNCHTEVVLSRTQVAVQQYCFGIRDGVLCSACLSERQQSKWGHHLGYLRQLREQEDSAARKRINKVLSKR